MEMVTLTLIYIRETEKAILVTDTVHECWLPKSQIEFEDKDLGQGVETQFEVPTWLAIKNELV